MKFGTKKGKVITLSSIMHFIVEGHDILFVNQSRSTRHGFAHDTTLFIDDLERSNNSCYYLNRTWECYKYQTVMRGAVRKLIDTRRVVLEERFKDYNGYKKMTPKRREEFEGYIADDSFLNTYNAIMDKIERR